MLWGLLPSPWLRGDRRPLSSSGRTRPAIVRRIPDPDRHDIEPGIDEKTLTGPSPLVDIVILEDRIPLVDVMADVVGHRIGPAAVTKQRRVAAMEDDFKITL